LHDNWRFWLVFLQAYDERCSYSCYGFTRGASLDQFVSLFRESHPSWPQFMGVVGISGVGIVVTAIGGTWTAANKVMDAQLEPIKKDLTMIKESQQQTAATVQEISLQGNSQCQPFTASARLLKRFHEVLPIKHWCRKGEAMSGICDLAS